MNWITRIARRRRIEAELSEEIRQHLAEKIDDLVESGMSRDEAAAAAHRQFGNVTAIEERGREVWRWRRLEDLLHDTKYAVRQLRRQPSFALVSLVTLALAIGANTTVFSIVNAVLLRPLPFAEPDRLVSVQPVEMRNAPRPALFSYPNFFDVRAANRVFERIAAYRDASFNLRVAGRAVPVQGEIVSWDLFALLGVQPAAGRWFLRDEEQPGRRVVVVGYGLWQELLGGDPTIVGRSVAIDGTPQTVVGVTPPGFRFPLDRPSVQLWTTAAVDAGVWHQRGARQLNAIARMKPGVTIAEAAAQVDVIAGGLAKQYPVENANYTRAYVRPELERTGEDARRPLLVLMTAVGLVLLVACANIAGLLLARSEERAREFALRASIGASRQRLVRQLLTEGLVLAAAGGVLGVLVATAAVRGFPAALGARVPRLDQLALDGRVLLFTVSVVVFTCLLFSLSTVLQLARAQMVEQLKAGARAIAPGRDRLRRGLVAGQMALSLALVTGAGLLLALVADAVRTNLGFRPENVIQFGVSLPEARYDASRRIAFYERLFDGLSAIPGVQSVGAGGPLPMTGNQMVIGFDVPGKPTTRTDRPRANVAIVTPGFFQTLGIPVVAGRDFTPRDEAGAPPVAIANQAFAARFFAGEDPIGRTFRPGIGRTGGEPELRRIVGIVGNARQFPFGATETPIYYVPFRQVPWTIDAIVIRTPSPLATVAPSVRAQIEAIDDQAAIDRIRPLSDLQSEAIEIPVFLGVLLGSFAAMALLLAAVGLYGLISHAVTRRTNEIGIRIALGATPAKVVGLVLRQAMTLVGAGLVIGLCASILVAQVLAHAMDGVRQSSAPLLVASCFVTVLAAASAAYFPARRAASIEPVAALRAE